MVYRVRFTARHRAGAIVVECATFGLEPRQRDPLGKAIERAEGEVKVGRLGPVGEAELDPEPCIKWRRECHLGTVEVVEEPSGVRTKARRSR